jgi:hypothetical protein
MDQRYCTCPRNGGRVSGVASTVLAAWNDESHTVGGGRSDPTKKADDLGGLVSLWPCPKRAVLEPPIATSDDAEGREKRGVLPSALIMPGDLTFSIKGQISVQGDNGCIWVRPCGHHVPALVVNYEGRQ